MGLLGGDSKSSTENKDTAFNNVDYGSGAESKTNVNLALDGHRNTITNNIKATDFGAVQGGLDVAKSALDNITSLASSSLESSASLASSSVANNASLANQAAKNGSEKVLDKTTKMITVMFIGGGLLFYVMRKKG